MSHHAQQSPEAIQQLKAQKRNSTILAIIIALLVSALIVAILFFIALSSIFKNEEQLISYSPGSAVLDDITEPQTTSEVKKQPSAPSSMSKVIAANTPSPTAIPIPKDTIVEPSLDFGNGNDFGDSWGGSNFGDGAAGAGKNTPFGKTGGKGLKGTFYDLKQDRDKKPTRLAKDFEETKKTLARIPFYMRDIKKIHRANYSASSLNNYFKASADLTFTHLAITKSPASIAPKAFGVEKEVEAAGWLIVYEGTMVTNAPRKVRFTGRFDDLLIVQINNKVVFDGSWSDYSGKLNESNELPGPSIIHNEMIKGDKFVDLRRGDKIRILVGESPGGHLGGGLFVAEEGITYKKNSGGQDILPPFTTQPLNSEDVKRLRATKYPMELNNVPVFKIE